MRFKKLLITLIVASSLLCSCSFLEEDTEEQEQEQEVEIKEVQIKQIFTNSLFSSEICNVYNFSSDYKTYMFIITNNTTNQQYLYIYTTNSGNTLSSSTTIIEISK